MRRGIDEDHSQRKLGDELVAPREEHQGQDVHREQREIPEQKNANHSVVADEMKRSKKSDGSKWKMLSST